MEPHYDEGLGVSMISYPHSQHKSTRNGMVVSDGMLPHKANFVQEYSM